MDKRRSRRTAAKVRILLFNHGLPVAVGFTSNVSEEGVFIHTDYAPLASSQPIEIEFLPGHRHKRRGNDKHPAVVTRVDTTGFALRFEHKVPINIHRDFI